MFFRILAGSHAEAEYKPILGPDNKPLLDADGYPRKHRNLIVYRRDDVVETNTDLAKRYNPPISSGMSMKFEAMTKEHAESYLKNRRESRSATIGDVDSQNPQMAMLQKQMAEIQHQMAMMLGQAPVSQGDTFNAGTPDKPPPVDPNSLGSDVLPDHVIQPQFQSTKTAANTGKSKTPVPPTTAGHSLLASPLDDMNLKELQEFAKSEEIDLKGVKQTKEDVVKAIRATGLV